MGLQSSRFISVVVLAVIIVTSFLVAHQLNLYDTFRIQVRNRPYFRQPIYHSPSLDELRFGAPQTLALPDIIKALYKPLVTPVAASSFVDRHGRKHELPGDPVWIRSLGRRLCIVDIDTRPLDEENMIMNPAQMNWDNFQPVSAGMLNHYMYALIHGYTYHFIRTPPAPDRAPYWTKIPALASTLSSSQCDITISIDADATFMNLNLPFEWLLNRWRYTRHTSLMMAVDPLAPQNMDAARNNTNLNAGFVIAQNLPRTHEILQAWASCPDDEVRYPECGRWKDPWPAEQAAFSEYIRYEFDREDDIRTIECGEANGFPESETECQGMFLRHHWTLKELTKESVVDALMPGMMARFHADFVDRKDEVVVTRANNEFPEL
ncbi:hypothetical protein EJ08DRAFT_444622 [Tothia fuscella]|uniref:Nucleotide-diphospho-sugar transferase domain-containing protein n=1 Tax=Tothia fuscella TaxID=1048955 RepID=A0A9P4NIW4_9PEZI|nr:hypothetical protein EJ08DRAFT_444622 [Tothia fuscella]